jgi:hypothetical protein
LKGIDLIAGATEPDASKRQTTRRLPQKINDRCWREPDFEVVSKADLLFA